MSPIDGAVTVGGLTFSAQLFRAGFASGHGPCRCASTCCMSGVFLDLGERDRILEHADQIAQQMDATQDRRPASWFDSEEIQDGDFPSGRCVGTSVVNDKCAFLDQRGRCSAQVAAVESGLDRWAWKRSSYSGESQSSPFLCREYPSHHSTGNGLELYVLRFP